MPVCGLLLLTVGYMLAWRLDDPHMMERFGALVSGSAALFVVIQVGLEIQIDNEKRALERGAVDEGQGSRWQMVLPRALLNRVRESIMERKAEELSSRRMRFVMIVATTAAIGEAFHGFGDIIYEIISSTGRFLVSYNARWFEYAICLVFNLANSTWTVAPSYMPP